MSISTSERTWHQLTTGFIVLIGIIAVPVLTIDCSSLRNINLANTRCLKKNGIHFELPPDALNEDMSRQMEQAISFGDPQAICSNLDAYRNSLVCLTRNARECTLRISVEKAGYLPSDEQMIASQNYLCLNRRDFNASCVNPIVKDILQCSSVKAGALVFRKEFTRHQRMCMSVELALDCARELTERCGSRTKDIYVHFNILQYPTKCSATISRATVPRALLVLSLWFVTSYR